MSALLSYPSVELKNQRLDMIIFDSAGTKHYHINFDAHSRCRFLGCSQVLSGCIFPRVFPVRGAQQHTDIT